MCSNICRGDFSTFVALDSKKDGSSGGMFSCYMVYFSFIKITESGTLRPGAHDTAANWCRHLANSTIGPIVWKHDVIHKTGSIRRLFALSLDDDRPTATGNMCNKFAKLRCGFSDMRADRHNTILRINYLVHLIFLVFN